MRAVLVREFTEYQNLCIEDVDAPARPGPGQVLIEVHAVGVSFAHSLVVAGRYQRRPPLPFVPGTEVAGVVSAVGEGVDAFASGDRVLAVLDWGGWAETVIANAVNCFALPDGIPFTRAVPLALSYPTSYVALLWPHGLDLSGDHTLLVHGAGGGVGIAALEIGRIVGAKVIATAGSSEKRHTALAHGADHAIEGGPGFREKVLELTDGRGADRIYDPIGGDVFNESLRCIATEGRIVPIGFACGRIPQIPANILLLKNIAVCGVNYGHYVGWSPSDMRHDYESRVRAMMDDLFKWTLEGQMQPTVSRIFALEEVVQAMDSVIAREVVGRVVLAPQGAAAAEADS